MLVGTLLVQVFIPEALSLKDKRQVVKGVVQRVQNKFNVSVAELYNEDLWQRATIGVAIVGDDSEYLQRQLQFVLNFLDSEPRWEVTEVEVAWK